MKRLTSPTILAIRDLLPGYIGLLFLSAFVPILFLVGPLYGMQMSSRVLTSRNIDSLVMLTLIATFLVIMGIVLEHIRMKALQRIGIAIDARLGKSFFSGLYRDTGGGASAEAALQDLNRVRDTLSGSLVTSFYDTLWMPLLIFVLFLLHWAFGTLAIVVIVLQAALSFLNQYIVRKDSQRYNEANIAAVTFGNAVARTAEVSRALGMLPHLQSRWFSLHSAMLGWRYMAARRADIVLAVAKFLRRWMYVGIFMFGALLYLENELHEAAIFVALMIMLRCTGPIESFIQNWHQVPAFLAALDRLDGTLIASKEPAKITLPRPTGGLDVVRIWGTAPSGGRALIQDVSFSLMPGRALAVVGPSGAGKSCLARFVVNAWRPRQGTIQFGDYDYSHWNQDQLGRLMGYVPQEIEFLPGTVAENIARFHPEESSNSELLIAATELAGVQDLIGALPEGFHTRIGPNGYVLSGGQRQRLAVARAVFGNPYLVVLDEPNANLDAVGEQALGSTIQRLRARGTMVILVTHRMSLLTYCDDVLVLNGGTVQAFGERDQILNRLPRLKAPPPLALVANATNDRDA